MRREHKHLPKAEKITIKKNKKTNVTKFKLRTPKYLITLKVDGKERAEKIKQSIPAGKYFHFLLTFPLQSSRRSPSTERVKTLEKVCSSALLILIDLSFELSTLRGDTRI